MRHRTENKKAVQDANLVQPKYADGNPAFNFLSSLYSSDYFHATKFYPTKVNERNFVGEMRVMSI